MEVFSYCHASVAVLLRKSEVKVIERRWFQRFFRGLLSFGETSMGCDIAAAGYNCSCPRKTGDQITEIQQGAFCCPGRRTAPWDALAPWTALHQCAPTPSLTQ